MGILKWYKRDPNAALHGMMGLTLEECGAYNTVLDMIYAHDGAVEDNQRAIARQMGVDPRIWQRLRMRLLEAGKIYIHAKTIRNRRADEEVHQALHRVGVAREAADKRWATYNEIKGLRNAGAMLPTTTTTKLLSFLDARKLDQPPKKPPR